MTGKDVKADHEQMPEAGSLINFRCIEAYLSGDGRRMRPGKLFRSGIPRNINQAMRNRLVELKIKHIIDLRHADECQWLPADHIPGMIHHNFPMSAKPPRLMVEEASGQRIGNRIDRLIQTHYYDTVGMSYQRRPHSHFFQAALSQSLKLIIKIEDEVPILFHCAVGKDRTGLLAATIMAICQISKAQIIEEYLLTNQHYKTYIKSLFGEDNIEQQRANKAGFLACRQWIESFLAEVLDEKDHIFPYLEKHQILGAGALKQLQEKLLVTSEKASR